MAYFPNITISQNVIVDAANSTTANINSGATWNSAGVGTSTLGVNAIQITVTASQDLTVFVDQGSSNSSFQVTDSFDYNSLKGGNSYTVQACAAFVRVRATNTGASTATSVSIQTLLCPVVDAVPRSLDEFGNFQTTLHGFDDHFGNHVKINSTGAMNVNQPYRLVGTVFGTSNDANFWTPANSGTGSAATVNVIATLTSGTSNSGFGKITSVRSARFIFANPNIFRSTFRVTSVSVANTTRGLGAVTLSGVTPQDGFYFSFDANGVLSVNYVNAGSVTSVASGSFNGQENDFTLDTAMHAYEIMYIQANAEFYIDGVLIHTFVPGNVPMTSTLTLPVNAWITNSAGGTTSGTVEMWAGTILRLGRDLTAPIAKNFHGVTTATVLKQGAGRLHHLVINQSVNGSTITVYDALTATNPLASISIGVNGMPTDMHYDLDFYTGLTISTTNAATDVTVVYE